MQYLKAMKYLTFVTCFWTYFKTNSTDEGKVDEIYRELENKMTIKRVENDDKIKKMTLEIIIHLSVMCVK